MKIKLYNARHEQVEAFSAWERDFLQWLEESAEAFFADGGYAEIWNDREAFYLDLDVHTRNELKQRIKALAA